MTRLEAAGTGAGAGVGPPPGRQTALEALAAPDRLRSLFRPTGVAIVGASDTSPWTRNFYGNLTALGFGGAVVPVHPVHPSTFGVPNRPTLLEVDERVDLAVLLVPTGAVESVLEEAASARIPNAIVVAAGFGEQQGDGRAREGDLRHRAVAHGLTLLGPNCPGFVNLAAGVAPYGFALAPPLRPGPVAAVLQSGALASAVLAYARVHGVGISLMVSVGNECVVRTVDIVDYLVEDDETRVICLFLEEVRDGRGFLRSAERARAAGKAVVVMKVGRTPAGQRAALAHTGAVAGDDAVAGAAFRQAGVIRVDSLEEMLVTAGLLASPSRPRGRRMGVVTFSGGACDIIADRLAAEGLETPDFASATTEALAGLLPPFASASNPLDVTGFQLAETRARMPMSHALEIVCADPGLDFVLYMGVPTPEHEPEGAARRQVEDRAADVARSVAEAPLPVVLCSQTDAQVVEFTEELYARHGLYVLAGLDLGMSAIGHAVRFEEGRGRPPLRPLCAVPRRWTGTPPPGVWSEVDARRLLAAGGVPVVPDELVSSPQLAVEAAERLGYPVALKACAPGLAHKSEVGGVVLGVASADAVQQAYSRLARLTSSTPAPGASGVLVSPMRTGGLELVVGVRNDLAFGPALAVGLGGVFVEVLSDVALRLLPVEPDDVLEMLGELRAAPLLDGARGREGVDRGLLAEVVVAIATTALGLGDTLEALEVNPLFCAGRTIEVLDALVITRSVEEDLHSSAAVGRR